MNVARGYHSLTCVVCGEKEVIGRRKRRLYRFPRETDVCRAWIRAIGMESLIYMPLAELYEQVVCDAHFPQECFSERGSRLHKVTLPTISQYPSLPDNIMARWPKSAMRVNPQVHESTTSDESNETHMNLIANDEQVIDFNRPLMTCIETITHNERHRVKKPAGILNTISVPLMTYTSSLEQGTIFSAPEPKNIDFSKLPKLDFQYQSHAPAEPDSTQTNDFQVIDNVETSKQHTNKTDRHVGSEKVSYGLATKIFAKKAVKKAIVPAKSNRIITKSHSNKQSETKSSTSSIHSSLNMPQFDKSRITHHYKPVKKLMNPKVSDYEVIEAPNTSNIAEQYLTTKLSEAPDPFKDEDTENEMPLEQRLPQWNTAGFTNTELIFEPYSQYTTNVTPESPHAHVGDNNIEDYGLPLTKCMATVWGRQEMSAPVAPIDINLPLLRCVEILDFNNKTE